MTRYVFRAYVVALAINIAIAGAIIGINHAFRATAHDPKSAQCPPQPSLARDAEGR